MLYYQTMIILGISSLGLTIASPLSADCVNGSCTLNQTQTEENDEKTAEEASNDCAEGGDDPVSYYYFYEADMEDSWMEEQPTWPSRREDSWYDQLTR